MKENKCMQGEVKLGDVKLPEGYMDKFNIGFDGEISLEGEVDINRMLEVLGLTRKQVEQESLEQEWQGELEEWSDDFIVRRTYNIVDEVVVEIEKENKRLKKRGKFIPDITRDAQMNYRLINGIKHILNSHIYRCFYIDKVEEYKDDNSMAMTTTTFKLDEDKLKEITIDMISDFTTDLLNEYIKSEEWRKKND